MRPPTVHLSSRQPRLVRVFRRLSPPTWFTRNAVSDIVEYSRGTSSERASHIRVTENSMTETSTRIITSGLLLTAFGNGGPG